MIISADLIIFGDSKVKPKKGAVCIQEGKIVAIGSLEDIERKYPSDEIEHHEGATI